MITLPERTMPEKDQLDHATDCATQHPHGQSVHCDCGLEGRLQTEIARLVAERQRLNEQFQRETLRTSALTTIVQRFITEHRTKVLSDAEALLSEPINKSSIEIERDRLAAQVAALREALMEEKWHNSLYRAPKSALNQVPARGPLAGISGNDIRQLAEIRGWRTWEGEYDNFN